MFAVNELQKIVENYINPPIKEKNQAMGLQNPDHGFESRRRLSKKKKMSFLLIFFSFNIVLSDVKRLGILRYNNWVLIDSFIG